MKPFYDEKSLQTETSQAFGTEISDAVRPILEKYIKLGYCVRHLSHEAQAAVRDVELDHIVAIHYRNIKDRKKDENSN